MTAVYRFLYRQLRRLSGLLFSTGHAIQWVSLKMYDKSNYPSHRANKRYRKNYLKNGIGYAYDYLVVKYQELKVRLDK
jgi:hypothetical protein